MVKMEGVLDVLAPSASLLHGNVVSPDYVVEVGGFEVVSVLAHPPRMVGSHGVCHQ